MERTQILYYSSKRYYYYTVVVSSIPCQKDTISLKDRAQSIRYEIDKLKLHPNFYKFNVLYEFTDGKEYNFKFLR